MKRIGSVPWTNSPTSKSNSPNLLKTSKLFTNSTKCYDKLPNRSWSGIQSQNHHRISVVNHITSKLNSLNQIRANQFVQQKHRVHTLLKNQRNLAAKIHHASADHSKITATNLSLIQYQINTTPKTAKTISSNLGHSTVSTKFTHLLHALWPEVGLCLQQQLETRRPFRCQVIDGALQAGAEQSLDSSSRYLWQERSFIRVETIPEWIGGQVRSLQLRSLANQQQGLKPAL